MLQNQITFHRSKKTLTFSDVAYVLNHIGVFQRLVYTWDETEGQANLDITEENVHNPYLLKFIFQGLG